MEASNTNKMDTGDILGSSFDRVSRSLMAALERMSSSEAGRCAQSLLNKLVAKYGTADTFALPEDAAALLLGLVSFGAELNGDHDPLSAMDRFFTDHWWEAVAPTLPVEIHMEGEGGAATSTSASTGASMPTASAMGSSGLVTGTTLPSTTITGAVGEPTPPTQLVGVRPETDGCRDRVEWQLSGDRVTEINLDDSWPVQADEDANNSHLPESVDGGANLCHHPDQETVRAMELECERYKAALLQDWEDAVMKQAMCRDPVPAGVQFTIQGGVLSNRGIRGHTQSMSFCLAPGEAVTLRVVVEGNGLSSSTPAVPE